MSFQRSVILVDEAAVALRFVGALGFADVAAGVLTVTMAEVAEPTSL